MQAIEYIKENYKLWVSRDAEYLNELIYGAFVSGGGKNYVREIAENINGVICGEFDEDVVRYFTHNPETDTIDIVLTITEERIIAGIDSGVITFIPDPNLGGGCVAKIGDNWFYFGGHEAEDASCPEEYVSNVPKEDTAREIREALEGIFWVLSPREYAYYDLCLKEAEGRLAKKGGGNES